MKKANLLISAGFLALAFQAPAQAADEEAAKALLQSNNCTQCHGIKKDKDGPSFLKTAEKFQGKATAVDDIVKHLTSGKKVKLADGTSEEHKIAKTIPPNDTAQLKNLAQWILSVK
ncbi:MAG: hypothetical protein RIR00_1821 [Pseudomonadota bacterium]|jgi:cytochrome c